METTGSEVRSAMPRHLQRQQPWPAATCASARGHPVGSPSAGAAPAHLGHRRQKLLLGRWKGGRPQRRHRLLGHLDRPTGSASDIATPTTSGADPVHSSSVKSRLDVMATSWSGTPPKGEAVHPVSIAGSSSADDGDGHRLLQACPTGPDGLLRGPHLVHLVIRDGRSTAMRERTFQASAVAFLLGLIISLVWSFVHAPGF
jgi:hypothetical protein